MIAKPAILEGLESARRKVELCIVVIEYLERATELQGLRMALAMINAEIAYHMDKWEAACKQEQELFFAELKAKNDLLKNVLERSSESPWRD